MVLWYGNIAHNNLVTNWRFSCSQSSLSFKWVWDCLNYLTCVTERQVQARNVCQDNCSKKESCIFIAIKIIIGFSVYFSAQSAYQVCLDEEFPLENCTKITYLNNLIMLFFIQNLVFMAARLGVTIFVTVFCCSCGCFNEEASLCRYEDDEHADWLISYRYRDWKINGEDARP